MVRECLGQRFGEVVATAHAYMPHNTDSRCYRDAGVGLVAVAPAYCDRGLGKVVNQKAIEQAFGRLGATHVYELVSADKVASRRMVEAAA